MQDTDAQIIVPRASREGEERDLASIDKPPLALPIPPANLYNFIVNSAEQSALESFKQRLFQAMTLKHYELTRRVSILPSLTSLLCAVHSAVKDRDTLIKVIANLYKTLIETAKYQHLLVVGDPKTFDLLQSIKGEYAGHLEWLCPFPGDWHILYNFQKALMKVYSDAGLKQLGEVSGHRAETLTSLVLCTNFKRTHNFLSQVVQAFYSFFLNLYNSVPDITNVLERVNSVLTSVIDEFASISEDHQVPAFSVFAQDQFSALPASYTYQGFHIFIRDLCTKQDTIKFWYQFVFEDCFSYMALYTSIRTRN